MQNFTRALLGLRRDHPALANEVFLLAALMDRRQGNFEKAIQAFNEAITLDPRNTFSIAELSETLYLTRQFRAADPLWDPLRKDPRFEKLLAELAPRD